jgi:hypothetical protein
MSILVKNNESAPDFCCTKPAMARLTAEFFGGRNRNIPGVQPEKVSKASAGTGCGGVLHTGYASSLRRWL